MIKIKNDKKYMATRNFRNILNKYIKFARDITCMLSRAINLRLISAQYRVPLHICVLYQCKLAKLYRRFYAVHTATTVFAQTLPFWTATFGCCRVAWAAFVGTAVSPGAITGPFTSTRHRYRQQQRGGKRGGKSPGGENLRIDMADEKGRRAVCDENG